jgi:hypothetical protein
LLLERCKVEGVSRFQADFFVEIFKNYL